MFGAARIAIYIAPAPSIGLQDHPWISLDAETLSVFQKALGDKVLDGRFLYETMLATTGVIGQLKSAEDSRDIILGDPLLLLVRLGVSLVYQIDPSANMLESVIPLTELRHGTSSKTSSSSSSSSRQSSNGSGCFTREVATSLGLRTVEAEFPYDDRSTETRLQHMRAEVVGRDRLCRASGTPPEWSDNARLVKKSNPSAVSTPH